VRGAAVDARTDVYALGGVLHHCLTGRVPYPREHELDALSAHLSEPPPRPSTVSAELIAFDGVVGRAMSKDPNGRYASAGELGRAGLAAARAKRTRRSAVARRLRLARRRGVAVASAIAVVAVALVASVLLTARGAGAPKRGEPAARPSPIHLQQSPDRLAILGARVWALTSGGGQLARIDPAKRTVATFPSPVDLGGGEYPDLEAGFGSIWLAHANVTVGGVDRIDPVTVQAIQHIPLPGAWAVGIGSHTVWAVTHSTPERRKPVLAMIDPRRDRIVRSLRVGKTPSAVAEGDGAVWVADAGADAVYRVDPQGRRVVATIRVGDGPARLAVGSEAVWVANLRDRTLTRIDPRTDRVVGAPVSLGKEIEDIALAGATLWVASADATVVPLRARNGAVLGNAVPVGRPPLALASERGSVWVGSAGDLEVERVG
jgi:serine/threonine-protein kinase